MADAPLQSGFKVPPEVPRYFSERGLKPSFSWLDTWGEEHAHAFTVAKAVDVELLKVFRDSIAGAIQRGEGYEQWRQGLLPELARLGWVGKRLVADPEGQRPDKAVDFSSPRRLQLIFSANMRSARAAGQWDRIQKTKAVLPYLLYVRTTSTEPRQQHLRWAGTILPADDPFWRTHFPPNGWHCKCAVRQVSKFERASKLKEAGYSAERPDLTERTFVNRRTGEITRVPDGIDPGWGHNPGLAAERRRVLAQALTTNLDAAGGDAERLGGLPSRLDPGQVAPASQPFPRERLQKEARAFVQGEDFARAHAEARAKRAARRAAAQDARRKGADAAREAKAAEAAAPLSDAKLPVAVMPERLDEVRGLGPVTVTVDEAAIGASGPFSPAQWTAVQDVLERGEIQGAVGEPDRLWGTLTRDKGRWSVPFARIRGAWQALSLTIERVREGLPAGRTVLMREADPEP